MFAPFAREVRKVGSLLAITLVFCAFASERSSAADPAKMLVVADARQDAANLLFKQALKLYQDGDFEGARENFELGLSIDDGNAVAHYYYAKTLEALGGLGGTKEAFEHYRRASELGPETKEGIIAGAIVRKQEHADKALTDKALAAKAFRAKVLAEALAAKALPVMVEIPQGRFRMGGGDLKLDYGLGYCCDEETPVHPVTIGYRFAVGKYEVTFDEWNYCVADGGCGGYLPEHFGLPEHYGIGLGRRPMVGISWNDTKAYVSWLSGKTGQKYRLLSEAEWEYVARAGTTTAYNTGSSISKNQASYDGMNGRPVPVGSYSPNAFGLYDVHGNVWEWTEDCWNIRYFNAPVDGSAWVSGDCGKRVMRGGSWRASAAKSGKPTDLRSAWREKNSPDVRGWIAIGFRVARTL